jgi:glutathionyl-hydroquinone reductase
MKARVLFPTRSPGRNTSVKRHYYRSHASINPTRIVPVGPELDFLAPHRREFLPGPRP